MYISRMDIEKGKFPSDKLGAREIVNNNDL